VPVVVEVTFMEKVQIEGFERFPSGIVPPVRTILTVPAWAEIPLKPQVLVMTVPSAMVM